MSTDCERNVNDNAVVGDMSYCVSFFYTAHGDWKAHLTISCALHYNVFLNFAGKLCQFTHNLPCLWLSMLHQVIMLGLSTISVCYQVIIITITMFRKLLHWLGQLFKAQHSVSELYLDMTPSLFTILNLFLTFHQSTVFHGRGVTTCIPANQPSPAHPRLSSVSKPTSPSSQRLQLCCSNWWVRKKYDLSFL